MLDNLGAAVHGAHADEGTNGEAADRDDPGTDAAVLLSLHDHSARGTMVARHCLGLDGDGSGGLLGGGHFRAAFGLSC